MTITLTDRLNQYITVRRRYGGNWASCALKVRPFAAFADAEGAEWITVDLFLRWRKQFGTAGAASWSVRLSAVRTFAAWLQGIDPRTEVPPLGLIAHRAQRRRPHIYSDVEICRIVTEAAKLPSRSGLRGATHATLFGLLAVTGMRIGEAIALNDSDVDLNAAIISVRHAKNGRCREVPFTSCTAERIQEYLAVRTRILGPATEALFCSETGRRLSTNVAEGNFVRVSRTIGLRDAQSGLRHGCGPHLHDLRHTLATKTIIDWFRQGRDMDAEMYKLSTFLGHAKPGGTYWYIEAVPELLALVSARSGQPFSEGEAE